MPNILVVDDMAVDRRMAGGLLEKNPSIKISYASNGAEALARMHSSVPDLLVTDLQMPKVDGLELVMKVRLIYPNVPVILMTAMGSEATALAALERGATGYVPKSQLNEMLLDTVESALEMANADKAHNRLMACQKKVEFHYELDNDISLVDALADRIQKMIGGIGLTDHTGKYRIGVAVREAMLNALVRGNLEIGLCQAVAEGENSTQQSGTQLLDRGSDDSPFCDRKIHVRARISKEEALFVIRDEGPGFDHQAAMDEKDLKSLGALKDKQGRGLILMRSFMDKVEFNEAGNEVTLTKYGGQ